MSRYLVEVSQPQAIAAKRIQRSVSMLGSHFATHADWRHRDGVATASMVVEAADRWGALGIVPPALRPDARIVPLEAAIGEAPPSMHRDGGALPHAIAA